MVRAQLYKEGPYHSGISPVWGSNSAHHSPHTQGTTHQPHQAAAYLAPAVSGATSCMRASCCTASRAEHAHVHRCCTVLLLVFYHPCSVHAPMSSRHVGGMVPGCFCSQHGFSITSEQHSVHTCFVLRHRDQAQLQSCAHTHKSTNGPFEMASRHGRTPVTLGCHTNLGEVLPCLLLPPAPAPAPAAPALQGPRVQRRTQGRVSQRWAAH